jgi:hypothetical protein
MIDTEFLGHGFTVTPALGSPLGRTGGKLRRDSIAERNGSLWTLCAGTLAQTWSLHCPL